MEQNTGNTSDSKFEKFKNYLKTLDKKDIAIMIIIPSILIPAYLVYKAKTKKSK